jgi:hypothetical protein
VVALYDRDLLGVSIDGPRVAEANFPAEAFEGMPLNAVMPPADFERLEPHYRAALEGTTSSHELTPLDNGVVYHVEIIPFRPYPDAGIEGIFNVARDITARKRTEVEAAQRTAQQAAVAELGVAALEGTEVVNLMDEAAVLVASTLRVEFCELLELTADRPRAHRADAARLGVPLGLHLGFARQSGGGGLRDGAALPAHDSAALSRRGERLERDARGQALPARRSRRSHDGEADLPP